MNHRPGLKWQPIQDLPENWHSLADPHLPALVDVWREQAHDLRESKVYSDFLEKLRREIAIETGLIERLYTIDRGTTQLLIEQGIDESLMAHNTTDRPVSEVVALIRSQDTAIQGVFQFVSQERNLSTSYIKQLHQVLTEHQPYVDGMDQFGNPGQFSLLRGDWKRMPNNPLRQDGVTHEYAPPEQVASEMDRLLGWHEQHLRNRVQPDVESAWLHHRFTQIHPFQDGNGRVARLLATLVFLRAGWFLLAIRNDDRVAYIAALEDADHGDLQPLVKLFSAIQRKAFKKALSLSEQILTPHDSSRSAVIAAIANTLNKRTLREREAAAQTANNLFKSVLQYFERIRAELHQALHENSGITVQISSANDSDRERRAYNRYQVIDGARQLDYFANLAAFHNWLVLRLFETGVRNTQFEILLSMHILGQTDRGIFAVSVLGYWKDRDTDERVIIRATKPLIDEPFQFTATENTAVLETQFREWLDRAVVVGLETWRRGL
jgi:Fic family protein